MTTDTLSLLFSPFLSDLSILTLYLSSRCCTSFSSKSSVVCFFSHLSNIFQPLFLFPFFNSSCFQCPGSVSSNQLLIFLIFRRDNGLAVWGIDLWKGNQGFGGLWSLEMLSISLGNVFGSYAGVSGERRLVSWRNLTSPLMTLTVVSLELCKWYRATQGQGALIGIRKPCALQTVQSHTGTRGTHADCINQSIGYIHTVSTSLASSFQQWGWLPREVGGGNSEVVGAAARQWEQRVGGPRWWAAEQCGVGQAAVNKPGSVLIQAAARGGQQGSEGGQGAGNLLQSSEGRAGAGVEQGAGGTRGSSKGRARGGGQGRRLSVGRAGHGSKGRAARGSEGAVRGNRARGNQGVGGQQARKGWAGASERGAGRGK
ncbi:putative signal peptide protein [Puccinia sorghi]|uniref:Putative signal peptide protein n=1 Tax=Puccinia sorghi TaxID=27349 RepID=A0A0L6VKP6_9BASI|nr:putative signal peptide protein [Puccinia sorghi]